MTLLSVPKTLMTDSAGQIFPMRLQTMKRTFLFIALSAAMLTPAFAAMTDEECAAAWVTADTNKDGSLDSTESARYSLRCASRINRSRVTRH